MDTIETLRTQLAAANPGGSYHIRSALAGAIRERFGIKEG